MSGAARSPITSHVLDTALGRPAAGMRIQLDMLDGSTAWIPVSTRVTDADGRAGDFLAPGALAARTYRLTFDTGAYFGDGGRPVFYPRVEVTFTVLAPTEHHHIPLLLSPFSYSTYRGS